MRNVTAVVLTLVGAVMIGVGFTLSLEGSDGWWDTAGHAVVTFFGGMMIGGGLWWLWSPRRW